MSRQTIFVLGMGRSGTSTVAAVLRKLGVDWGPDQFMMPPHPTNPFGHWEFTPLHQINVRLLQRFNSDWHSPPVLADGWERSVQLDDLKADARNRIAWFFRTNLWGFKDPRCCITLPFWKCVIDNQIDCVIPIRNPLEVAASLLHRDKTPISRGLWLWNRYVKYAWRTSRGLRRHLLEYEALLDNPEIEVKKIQTFIGLGTVTDAASCVTKDLKHERFTLKDLQAHPEVREATKVLYGALIRRARGERPDDQEIEKLIW